MRRLEFILAGSLAVASCGCVLRAKPEVAKATTPAPKPVPPPVAPPAPPPPLSTPQTHAELPAPQPITAEALATTRPPEEPPLPPPPAPRTTRRQPRGEAAAQVRPAEAPATAAAPQGPVAPPAAEERAPVQEIVPAGEQNKLREDTHARRAEIQKILESLQSRQLSRGEEGIRKRILSFVKDSVDKENHGEMRQAYELAERGAVLARGLTGGK